MEQQVDAPQPVACELSISSANTCAARKQNQIATPDNGRGEMQQELVCGLQQINPGTSLPADGRHRQGNGKITSSLDVVSAVLKAR